MNCLGQTKKFKNKHPVWSDPDQLVDDFTEGEEFKDDDEISVPIASDHENESSDDDDHDLYANDVRSKRPNLETKELTFKHLTNINNDRSYTGAITTVKFHPKSKIGLIGLSYGQVDLYEIDGERNRYLQNIKLPKTKLPFCSFTEDGNSIVISSERYKGSFYTYDLVSSAIKKYSLQIGYEAKSMTDFTIHGDHMACRKEDSQEIYILNSKTYENTYSLKINEPAKAVQFISQNELLVAGMNAQVYLWDLRKTSTCRHKFQDEGSVHATSLSYSESSKQLSIGSDSGFVNSYMTDECFTKNYPVPVKTYRNLKTTVDIMKYNSSGELLLIGSSVEPGAFRMIHSHSGTVYKNFPAQGKKYGHLCSSDFSPLSGYLALGCSTGRAYLCRLPYYKAY